MINFRHQLVAMLVLGSLCLLPGNARAETYHNCAGVINSLPVTISTQGVWCLRKDLATSMTSGDAINITVNNVTIDCNDFKIGGLGAGNTSTTRGIYAQNRQNVTVRHCAIRGFNYGIYLGGGAGHLVEDNRLDNNLSIGIYVVGGDNNRVQRNRVYDTGGYPGLSTIYGIEAAADVIDNTVAGVYGVGAHTYPRGIAVYGNGSEARGNQVRGLVVAGSGYAMGIFAGGYGTTFADNRISATATTVGSGIYSNGGDSFCSGNTVVNFAMAYYNCEHNFGNLQAP